MSSYSANVVNVIHTTGDYPQSFARGEREDFPKVAFQQVREWNFKDDIIKEKVPRALVG